MESLKIPLLDLKRQYQTIWEEVNANIDIVLESANYVNGPLNKKFEKKVMEYVNSKHAIGVANGTDALIIALEALNIGIGDEVITTTWTFFATAEAIAYVGATPVFVDVSLDDYNILTNEIEDKITVKTKAIIAVHIFGNPCDMDSIEIIAKKHNLFIIEDAAQAIGSSYKGKMIGGISDITTFSFFPTKNLGAFGDGGMITTNSDKLATIIRALKNHGSGDEGENAYNLINSLLKINNLKNEGDKIFKYRKYFNYIIGHNSRLDEIQAAVLLAKINYLDIWNEKRNINAKEYNEKLKGVKTPCINDNSYSSYHLYVLQSDFREELINYLNSNGISTGVYYPIPLHMQKAFEYLNYKVGSLPNSEYLAKKTMAIPAHEMLTKKEINYIIEKINSFEGEIT